MGRFSALQAVLKGDRSDDEVPRTETSGSITRDDNRRVEPLPKTEKETLLPPRRPDVERKPVPPGRPPDKQNTPMPTASRMHDSARKQPMPRVDKRPGNPSARVPAETVKQRAVEKSVAQAEPSNGLAQNVTTQVIRSTNDIPSYQAVLTAEGGPFYLHNTEDREHVVALRLQSDNPDEPRALVLHTPTPQYATRAASLIARLRHDGYLASKRVADPAVIFALRREGNADAGGVIGKAGRIPSGKYEEALRGLVREAVEAGASDIHMNMVEERGEMRGLIRIRVNGDLRVIQKIQDGAYMEEWIRTIYDVISEDEKSTKFSARKFQECQVAFVYPDGVKGIDQKPLLVRGRCSNTPGRAGAIRMVIRLLPQIEMVEAKDFCELGYSEVHKAGIIRAVQQPFGLLILAGTTGSGKTTSLANVINYVADITNDEQQIYTVEDPIEYLLPRAFQQPVLRDSESGEDPFVASIRAAMRQDPDYLMIGEIRDMDTAQIALRGAMTGHPVFTTLHAAKALGIVERLENIGVSSRTLGSSSMLQCLVYQRLVQTLCLECRIPFEKSELAQDAGRVANMKEVARILDGSMSNVYVRGHGCKTCGVGRGVTGRTIAAETVVPDRRMREMFGRMALHDAEMYWMNDLNQRHVVYHAAEKVFAGVVGVDGFERATEGFDGLLRHEQDLADYRAELTQAKAVAPA